MISAVLWTISREDLTAPAKLVAVILADMADASGSAWPTVKTVAKRTALSERCVRASIAQLQKLGVLTVEHRHRNGSRISSLFRFPAEALQHTGRAAADHDGVRHEVPEVPEIRHQVPDTPASGAADSGMRCRTLRHEVPIEPVTETVIETVREPKEAAAAPAAPPAAAAPPSAGDLFGQPVGKAGPPAVAGQDAAELAFQAWNATAGRCGLQPARLLTADRRKALRDRIRDAGGLDGFRAVLDVLAESPFALGGGSRGWKIGLDEFLSPKKFAAVAEGSYREIREAPAKPGSRMANLRELDKMREMFAEGEPDEPHAGPTIDAQAEPVWPPH